MKIYLNHKFRAKSVSLKGQENDQSNNLPAINGSTIPEDDEEDKGPTNKFVKKRNISQISRRQLQISNRIQNIGKVLRKVFAINTYPSRSELETLQLIIQKNDWEEV